MKLIALTKAVQGLKLVVEHLQTAQKMATPVESLILLDLLREARDLYNRVDLLKLTIEDESK